MIPQRHRILGAPVDALDMEGALERAARLLDGNGEPGCVLAVNPEKIYFLRAHPELMDFFERAALLIPDGIGVVWALRTLAGVRTPRVAGVDCMERLCALAAERGDSIFLFGAAEEINRKASETLPARFPGLRVAGRSNGYVSEEAMPALLDSMRQSGARILFVGMGSPKQEQWVRAHLACLPTIRVCQCVGGSFDVVSGAVRRAPRVFRQLHLEWFYRLACQPTRWRRQMNLLRFVGEVLTRRLHIR